MYRTTTRKPRGQGSRTERSTRGTRESEKTKRATAPRRPMWIGSIAVGLMNVPVKLYPMIYNRGVKFHFLHKTDKQPLRYERICTRDEQVVPWQDVVKGYEVTRNEYVVFDQEELEAAKPESDRRIHVDKFVDYFNVDPIYFYNNYILIPDRSSDAYSLLLTALSQMGKAGAGRITMREKEYPALIHAYKDTLILTTMRYTYDVVDPINFEELNQLEVPERSELNIAKKIITELSGNFDISEYQDNYRVRLEELIQKKLKGEPVIIEKEPPKEEIKGLMAALQETLRQLEKR